MIILNKGNLVYYGDLTLYYQKYMHYSHITLGDNQVSDILDKIKENSILTTSKGDIFTKNSIQHNFLLKLFESNKIEYKTVLQNTYSTYIFSLEGLI